MWHEGIPLSIFFVYMKLKSVTDDQFLYEAFHPSFVSSSVLDCKLLAGGVQVHEQLLGARLCAK